MIFLFIPGGGRTDNGSHSISQAWDRSGGKAGFRLEEEPQPRPVHNPGRQLSGFSACLFS